VAAARTATWRLLALFSVVACAVAVVVLTAHAAFAHATLERTDPAASAHLAAEPAQVGLFFDERVNLALGQVTVIDPSGTNVAVGDTQSDGGKTVFVRLRSGAGDGVYVVSYRVISLDSHPVSGGFFFQVGDSSSAATEPGESGTLAPPTTGSASAPTDTVVRASYAASRYVALAGLVLLVGGAVFLVMLPLSRGYRPRLRRFAWLGYAMVVVASIGEAVLQAPYAAGSPLSGVTVAGVEDVASTTFGMAHIGRLAALALIAPVLLALGHGEAASRTSMWLAGVLGVGLLVTWAYSGHAATHDPAISLASDTLHLATMAIWIGGLVMLSAVVLPKADGATLRPLLLRWSRLAMACVALLAATGIVQSVLEVGGWTGLIDTTYGRLVLAKAGLLAVILVVANTSRSFVRRYTIPEVHAATSTELRISAGPLDPPRLAVSRLRRSVAAEAAVASVVIALATVLVQSAPGRTVLAATAGAQPAAATPITRHGPYQTSAQQGDVVLSFRIDPTVVGTNYFELFATHRDGRPLPVLQWTLTLSNDQLGLHDVNVPITSDAGKNFGEFTLPVAGTWTVRVAARTSDVDETVITRQVRVRPRNNHQ
jgi:copper transport protein